MATNIVHGAPQSSLARRVQKLIDPASVASAVGQVADLHEKAAAIHRDRELSDHGKSERIRAAADSRLANIASVAREFVSLEREHAARRSAILADAAPPSADAAQTLIDLELGRLLKAEPPSATALTMASERVRQAVARLPAELTGVSEETRARVIGSLVSADEAWELEEEATTLAAARRVLQSAIDDVAPSADWGPQEMLRHFGADTGWHLRGVVPTLEMLRGENAPSEAEATE